MGPAVLLCAALLNADEPPPLPTAQATPEPTPAPSAAPADKRSRFRSPEDGWFDVSGFLDEAYGFVPIAAPVTEPAIGYGAAGALMFIGKPAEGSTGLARPSISVVGGLGTENDTWAGLAADVRHWGDNRVQTVVGVVKASVNLDFSGTGDEAVLEDRDIGYNLEPIGGMAQVKYRLRSSRAWVGLNYTLAETIVSFDVPEGTPGLPTTPRETRIAGLTPSLTYDSRDSLFTTGRGAYVEAGAGFYGSAFGGDVEYQKITLVAMQFLPVHPKVHLGLRLDGGATYGDPPFYLRPFVSLRGAPIMRYQRDNLAQGEAEARWQFWRRFSVVGFAGHGVVWNDETEENAGTRKVSVTTGGGGIRYELARRYKLHMGADVAFGPDGAALYIQFGSAWSRP